MWFTEANTTEEPREGKLHAGICVGVSGDRHSYHDAKKSKRQKHKMKLPRTEAAIIPQSKIQDYLLSHSHPIGKFKAIIFNDLGYSQHNWSKLQSDLKELLGKDAIEKEVTEYGKKYEIRGKITGPNGKSRVMITAWIILKDEDFPRFITAYSGV